jgi:hypothetical protein
MGGAMTFTQCPNCHKIQQVSPELLRKPVGCMNTHCNISFDALEYQMHSGKLFRLVFLIIIVFALIMLGKWVWTNAAQVVGMFG